MNRRVAPISIFLHVSGQNESVHIKTTDTLLYDSHDLKINIYLHIFSSLI